MIQHVKYMRSCDTNISNKLLWVGPVGQYKDRMFSLNIALWWCYSLWVSYSFLLRFLKEGGGGERKTSLVTSLYSARDDRRHFRGKKRMMTARLPFVCSLISRKNFCAISGSLSRLFLFLMHLISAQFTKTEGECKSAEIGQRSERLEQIRL